MARSVRPLLNRLTPHTSLRALLVVVLFVVAQAVGILHLIEHDADGNNDRCEICQVTAHFSNAAVPEVFQFTLPVHIVMPVAEAALPHFCTALTPIYASRAPPALA